MKILQVINAYYPPYSAGGAAIVVHNISKALAKRGHEVTVYTTNALSKDELFQPKKNPNYSNGVKVYYFGNQVYKPSVHIYFSKELVKAIKKAIANYDLVHLHEYRSYISLVTSYYAKKHDIPHILQAHGQLPRISAWRKLKRIYDVLFGYRLLRSASKVIALSKVEAEQYKAMGVPEEKIAIIPNGIDLSEYANLPPKGTFKRKFGIPEEKKIILYLGRIHKIKGIDFLIKAYAYLIEKMNCKDVVLVVAGPDDGYLSEAKALANSLRISDLVMFVGSLYGGDKLAAYIDSDLCVLPSRYESFPMALLEVYACGKPIIASNIGSLRELIIDGETGLLFEAGNFKQLAEKIRYLLSNRDKAIELGKKAKKLVEEKYSIGRITNMLEKLYRKVVLQNDGDDNDILTEGEWSEK